MAGNKVRYICPICDQELGGFRHFCWSCKRYIPEPWRFTGGHLPNEGHDGCHPSQTYMKPRTGSTPSYSHGGKNLTGKDNTSKQYTYNRPGQSSSSTGRSASTQSWRPYQKPSSYDVRTGNAPRKKKTGIGSLITVIMVFYFLMQFLMAFFRW